MSSKGPEAFRTISEVAGDLDLPQHVLRFWETRFSQIRPLKRGGGRRYYRPDDVELLKGIRHLLYSEGYTIRGVQRLLKEEGPRFVTAAGRGTVSVPQQAADQDEPEPIEPTYFEEEEEAASDEVVAPGPVRFVPPEFRSDSAGDRRAQGAPGGSHLAAEDIRRLEGTLAELLELKRLLDQARG